MMAELDVFIVQHIKKLLECSPLPEHFRHLSVPKDDAKVLPFFDMRNRFSAKGK